MLFLFFDALKDGFFHCCVIVFSISHATGEAAEVSPMACSDDFIVEDFNLLKKNVIVIFVIVVVVAE